MTESQRCNLAIGKNIKNATILQACGGIIAIESSAKLHKVIICSEGEETYAHHQLLGYAPSCVPSNDLDEDLFYPT